MSEAEAEAVCKNLHELRAFDKQDTAGKPRYWVTGLGKVADYIYLSPFDVHDFYENFDKLFRHDESLWEDAAGIAYCLTKIHSYVVDAPWLPQDKDLFGSLKQMYKNELAKLTHLSDGDVMTITVYYFLLAKGMRQEIPPEAKGILANLRLDLERIFTACELIDRFYASWGRSRFYWRKIAARILYGVNATQAELCCVKHIGAAKSDGLMKVGITCLEDLVDPNNRLLVESVLKSKAVESVVHADSLLKSEKRSWNKP